MIRPVVRDTMFLSMKSEPATLGDAPVARDLLDTLAAHAEECVGMAANMIGVRKRIIAVNMGPVNMILYNPVFVSRKGPFDAMEGCLSLTGQRSVRRYREIEIEYEDMNFIKRRGRFEGWHAQIVQHEMDHLEGILI